jgi:hypothetical protein
VKRIGRGKSIRTVIHMCMETTQENSLCSYLYLKLAKRHVSRFIFYVFFLYKIREEKGGTGSVRVRGGGVLAPVGGRRWQGKG